MTGDAFSFVAPEEEGELRAIERAIGERLPRVTLPGFDYTKRPAERFEVPIGERIAAIRARKAEERARTRINAERRAQQTSAAPARTDETPRRTHPGPAPRRRRGGSGDDHVGRARRAAYGDGARRHRGRFPMMKGT